MNSVHLHNNWNNKKILYFLFAALFFPLLYGTYKVILYNSNICLLWFKPIMFLIVPFICFTIINLIKEKKLIINYDTFLWTSLGLFMPININIFIYLILCVIFCLLSVFIEKININFGIIFKLIISFLGLFFYSNPYQIPGEDLSKFSYNFMDILLGKTISGISVSSFLMILLSFIILFFNKYYKKNTFLISSLIYIIICFIFNLFNSNFIFLSGNLTNNLFAFLLVETTYKYCPICKGANIIYSVCIAFLTFIINLFFFSFESVFISIFIMQIFSNYLDKMFVKH